MVCIKRIPDIFTTHMLYRIPITYRHLILNIIGLELRKCKGQNKKHDLGWYKEWPNPCCAKYGFPHLISKTTCGTYCTFLRWCGSKLWLKLNRLQVTGFDPSRNILFKNSLFAFLIVVTVQILNIDLVVKCDPSGGWWRNKYWTSSIPRLNYMQHEWMIILIEWMKWIAY